MLKNKYFGGRKQDPDKTPVVVPTMTTLAPDAAVIADPDGVSPGQVYEGVVVPDRTINIMGLTPGAKLGPLVIEAPYTQTNDGWWIAFFEGESATGIKLYVDAAMLRTGKLRK